VFDLCRVTSVIDALATSHAALLTSHATAMLSTVLQPPTKVHSTTTLCAADRHGLLQQQVQPSEMKFLVQFKVQAEVREAGELLLEWQGKAPDTAVGNLRWAAEADRGHV
jgi:hypothetical protein